ncbi:uncharacterized protein LOC123296444 [Chrysoperla carnea]|uniref:uncharacterized protein LOC123296444 n=1 Tax=Chrysoperla carnea TaxID=189513 RepID=UPI001D08EEFE|nr:uncharacterized protein LOC123296444 [Chrysoperla carnea]
MKSKFLNSNMTEQLDPSSVLAYLNEMGYYNISTLQLKEFLKDLRKLMKYEEKCNFQTNTKNYTEVVLEKSEQLYSTQTISSKAKTTKRCPDVLKENQNIDKIKENKNIESLEKKPLLEPSAKSVDDKPTCLSNIPNKKIVRECQSVPAKSVTSKKSIPRIVTSAKNTHLETDPVILYHQYKKEWERKKIPGENSHSRLRWKIRQKICQL